MQCSLEYRFLWLLIAGLLAGGVGCETADPDDDDDIAGDDDDDDDDDTQPPPSSPCAGGDEDWGQITDPEHSIHVRADGSDEDGDGTAANPLASVGAALLLSREEGQPGRIAIGPGTYSTDIEIELNVGGDVTDDGLAVEGCSVEEVVLEAADTGDAVIKVTGATGVRLAGFAVEGGRRALTIWQGADVTVEYVSVRQSARLGIIIGGWESVASLNHVEVSDTIMETDGLVDYGYGISVQEGTATMTDVLVEGSTTVGILGSAADLTMTRVTVQDTLPNGYGFMGRGLQLHALSMAVMDECAFTRNLDAGVHSESSVWLEMNDSTVTDTGYGALPGDPECQGAACPGEGVVVTQGGENFDPASFTTLLAGNEITGCQRAGIVIEDVSVDLSGNVAGADNGLADGGTSIYIQGDAIDPGLHVSGADSYNVLVDSLPLNNESVAIDEMAD